MEHVYYKEKVKSYEEYVNDCIHKEDCPTFKTEPCNGCYEEYVKDLAFQEEFFRNEGWKIKNLDESNYHE